MTVETASLLAAMLTVGALAVAVVMGGALIGGRYSTALAGLRDWGIATIGPLALWLAWFVVAASFLGSLYFSEVANFVPCNLCWYQRIAMYPLVIILAIAAYRDDVGIRPLAR